MRLTQATLKLVILTLLMTPYYIKNMEDTITLRKRVPFGKFPTQPEEKKDLKKEEQLYSYEAKLNDSFIKAILEEKDLQKASELLRKGADINVIVKDVNLPLFAYTVKCSYNEQELTSITKFFIGHLALDERSQTSFIEQATIRGYKDLAEFAKTQHALNKQLIESVQKGKDHMPTVRSLVHKGADVNSKTDKGWTILHIAAAEWEDPYAVQSLLDLGADPNSENHYGRKPLFLVEQRLPCIQNMERTKPTPSNRSLIYKLEQIIRVLNDLNILPEPTFELHKAIQQNKVQQIAELLKKGSDVNQRDKLNITPLLFAVQLGNLAAVKELLKNNADVNTHDGKQTTPLKLSVTVSQPQIEIVRELLAHGADPNTLDLNKLKLTKQIKQMIQTSIQKKAEADKSNRSPKTSSSQQNQRSEGGMIELVRSLYLTEAENLCDTSNKGTQGMSIVPEDVTTKTVREETNKIHLSSEGDIVSTKYLQEESEEKPTQPSPSTDKTLDLIMAVSGGEPERVKECLHRGCEVNGRAGLLGFTALHEAASKGNMMIIKILLDAGADVNARAIMLGTMPLHMAALKNQAEVIKELIRVGALVDAQDGGGNTPLHYTPTENSLNAIETLISFNANPNAQNSAYQTPSDLAHLKEKTEALKKLEQYGGKRSHLRTNQDQDTALSLRASVQEGLAQSEQTAARFVAWLLGKK